MLPFPLAAAVLVMYMSGRNPVDWSETATVVEVVNGRSPFAPVIPEPYVPEEEMI